MIAVPGIVLGIVTTFLPKGPRPVVAATAPTHEAPAAIPNAALRGRVVDEDGEPVPGARVWIAAPQVPTLVVVETESGGEGAFAFATVGGRARVLVVAEHPTRGCTVVGPVEPSEATVVLPLGAPRTVTGTVKTEDGTAIPKAVLTVDGPPSLVRRAETASDGTYDLKNLAKEAASVTVKADGFATVQRELPHDGKLDVVLKKDTELAGQVVDPDGKGVRAFVKACDGRRPEERIATKPDGTFALPKALAGCSLVAESDDHAPSLPQTATGDSVTLRLRAGGGIKGKVVDATGAPVQKFFVGVDAFSPEGREDASVRSGDVITGDDPEGAFHFSKLAPGRYVLSFGAQGGAPSRSKPIVLVAGQTVTLTLAVGAGGTVTGRVLGRDGQPLEGVKVMLDATVSAGSMPPGATSDDKGGWKLEHAPEGPFSVRFAKPGYRTKLVSNLKVAEGGELALPDVTLADVGDKAAGPEVSGIGGLLKQTRDGVAFGAVIDGSPAQRAGIREGDVIRKLDGESAALMSVGDLTQKLRGEAGSEVRLVLERDGVRLEVKLKRAVVSF